VARRQWSNLGLLRYLQAAAEAAKEVKKTSKNYDYATKINYLFRDARDEVL
jgi:hypothetical protein